MKHIRYRIATAILLSASVISFGQPAFARSGNNTSGSKSASDTTTSSTPGYDVVLLVGQSNMVGIGTGVDDAGDAAADPRIVQWEPYTNTIIPAFDPIYHNQALDYIGLPMTFAKAYAKRMAPGRQLLLVGAATGGTGFSSGYWQEPNGSGVTTALKWINAAMAAAGSNAKLVGILWHQGEADIYGEGGAAYETNLTNLISYFRSNITGASSSTPFIVGEMTYTWLQGNTTDSDYVTQQDLILNDFHTLPDTVPYTAWTSAAQLASDPTYGTVHFSALSQRQLGRRYADKFFEASNNLPQPQASLKWWAGSFFDDGRGLGSANSNTIPVNNLPAVSGTVTEVVDPVGGNVAQISQGQGWLTFQVPGATFNGSYTKMAWVLPGATGYTNNLVSAVNSGQTHFLSAQTVSAGNLLIAAGHSSGSLTPIVQAQVANTAGDWINIAVTYDSVARVMTLYANGAVVASKSNVAPAPSSNTTLQSLLMGSIGSAGTTGLDGQMAGNRAWTTALSAAQIASIINYEQLGPANEPGFGVVAGVPSEWGQYSVPYQVPSMSIAAASGSTASEALTVVPNNGFTGVDAISGAISGLPTGLSATFADGSNANSFTLQLSAGSALTPGTYPLVVTGSNPNNVLAEASLTLNVVNTANEIPVNLSSFFNHPDTIVTDGTTFSNGGADGSGYAYSATLLGTSLVSPNGQFTLGPPNTANSVTSTTVVLPSGNFSSIALLGTGIGAQTAQTFTVNYADGTSATFTQSLSNWCVPQQFPGESIAIALPYRDHSDGTSQNLNCFLYSYSFALNSSEIAQSITLPNNPGVLILAITVTGQLNSRPGFALTSSPSSLTVIPANSATSTIKIIPVNGFSGSVSLAASGLPSGVTASFASGSVAGTSLLTLSVSASTVAGTSNIVITGTSGALTASTTVSLTVTAANVTPVSLALGFNVYGIFNDNSPVTNGGLDTSYDAYSANLLGTGLVVNNIPYSLGAPGTANAASSATLALPSGNYSTLNFLATAVYGSQPSQTFVVAYTDGSTSTFTQSVSDWGVPQSYSGESIALKMAYRLTSTGSQQAGPWYLYAYSFALSSAKTVKSITLPNNRDVVVLAVTLSGHVGSTAQTITFNSIPTQTAGTPLTLTATASSGLAVTYMSSTTAVCSVSGKTVAFLAAGTCTITASQAGNATYAGAIPVSQSFAVQSISTGSTTMVSLASEFNIYGIFNNGSAVTNGGLDTADYAYSANLLGANFTFQSIPYSFGAPGAANAVSSTTLALPSGSYTTLHFLGTAVYGGQPSQTFIVNYTDGSSSSFTQSMSDWGKSQSNTGETIASTMTYRLTPTGAQQTGPWYLYAYSLPLPTTKTLKSLTLPVNRDVTVLAVTLSGLVTDGSQTITFNPIATQTVDTPLALTATASSGLPVTYSSATASICTVSGATASFLSAGTCTLTASQAGNVSYPAATPVTRSFAVQANTTPVSLTSLFNIYGIVANGSSVPNGGLDTAGNAYSSTLLGSSLTVGGVPFTLGAAGTANAVSGVTVALPAGSYSALSFLATGVFGSQLNQQFTVTYTDGTTSVATQSLSDWGNPQSHSGEAIAANMAYRLTPTGSQQNGPWYVYEYLIPLNAGKTVQSITLPSNRAVVVLAMTLSTGSLPTTSASSPYTTVCQAQQNGSGSSCSDQTPGALSSGYNPLPSWVNLGKTLSSIAVSDNHVWGLDASGTLWYLANFKAASLNWTQLATGVIQVSVGHSLVCQINSDAHLLCGVPPSAQTTAVNWFDTGATTYRQVAVSAGTKLWAVDGNNNLSLVNDYTHVSTTTLIVAPGVQQVAADGKGLLCVTDLSNNLNCSGWPVVPSTTDSNGYHRLSNWVSTGVQLQNIALADGKVYGTDSSGNVSLLPDYTNPATWEKIENGGANDKMAAASVPSSFQPGLFAPGEVAVMIFMGQSNASGINSWPQRFLAPSSPNVLGVTNQGWNFLAGNNNGTAPFTNPISSINSVQWSNFLVSANGSDMNLGFNTGTDGSAANYAAYQWQAMIDAGAQLPDLYIIHIAWASEGVDANDGGPSSAATWLVHGTSLWQPLLNNSQEPSYALAPFSRRILNLALSNLLASGKTPRIVGLQWNQWEAEAGSGNPVSIADAPVNYSNLFNGFYNAIGSHFPVQIVKPLSTAYGAANLSAMQTVFANLANGDPADYSLLDVSQVSSNIFSGGVLGGGDGSIHYNLDTQQWFANQAIGACLVQANCGTRITAVSTTPTN